MEGDQGYDSEEERTILGEETQGTSEGIGPQNLPRMYFDLAESLGHIQRVLHEAISATASQNLDQYHEELNNWAIANEETIKATRNEYMVLMDWATKHGDDKPGVKHYDALPAALIDWVGTAQDAEEWFEDNLLIPVPEILATQRAQSGSSDNGFIIIAGLLVLVLVFSQ
tara:strand:+ start:171 stop:680 length:510 start_codon:yes stop_codon:yes gene_type:complete